PSTDRPNITSKAGRRKSPLTSQPVPTNRAAVPGTISATATASMAPRTRRILARPSRTDASALPIGTLRPWQKWFARASRSISSTNRGSGRNEGWRPGQRAAASVRGSVAAQVAPQVGIGDERRLVAKARAIDLHVLHHPLHVVAGFHERDALDPVDGIDLRVARIAEDRHPVLHAPAPGIVARERQD